MVRHGPKLPPLVSWTRGVTGEVAGQGGIENRVSGSGDPGGRRQRYRALTSGPFVIGCQHLTTDYRLPTQTTPSLRQLRKHLTWRETAHEEPLPRRSMPRNNLHILVFDAQRLRQEIADRPVRLAAFGRGSHGDLEVVAEPADDATAAGTRHGLYLDLDPARYGGNAGRLWLHVLWTLARYCFWPASVSDWRAKGKSPRKNHAETRRRGLTQVGPNPIVTCSLTPNGDFDLLQQGSCSLDAKAGNAKVLPRRQPGRWIWPVDGLIAQLARACP